MVKSILMIRILFSVWESVIVVVVDNTVVVVNVEERKFNRYNRT